MTADELVQTGYHTGVEDALNKLRDALHEETGKTASELYITAVEKIRTLLGEKK